MNYADIKKVDVANGPGVRVSLFVSGCTHHCKECFNPETWDFAYGQPFGEEQIQTILRYLRPDHIKGLSVLGGEPFEPQNQPAVLDLIRRVRAELPEKDVWCYTGYLFEPLVEGQVGAHSRTLLGALDVLVDGPFVIEQKNLSLRFRGSENQRIIAVRPSLATGSVVLWDDENGV
jgi:anaerobic ribonucleoside-triphosphate reductase activating protein